VLVQSGVTSLDEIERVLGPVNGRPAQPKMPTAAPAAPVPDPVPAILESQGLSKRKVLLVEDNDDVRFILLSLLEQQMFAVREARDGMEALQRVYEEIPELIVCDLMMPRMDGIELVERLKRDARTARIPC